MIINMYEVVAGKLIIKKALKEVNHHKNTGRRRGRKRRRKGRKRRRRKERKRQRRKRERRRRGVTVIGAPQTQSQTESKPWCCLFPSTVILGCFSLTRLQDLFCKLVITMVPDAYIIMSYNGTNTQEAWQW